jgi:hypothetical protein
LIAGILVISTTPLFAQAQRMILAAPWPDVRKPAAFVRLIHN